MTRPTASTTAALLVLALLPACDLDSESSEQDEFRTTFSYNAPLFFGVCPVSLCGTNAGVAGALSINVTGEGTLDGKRLVEVLDSDNVQVELSIEGNELQLVYPGGDKVGGEGLIGAQLVMQDIQTETRTYIHIDDYAAEGVPSMQFEESYYPTYLFTYRTGEEPASSRTPLCATHPWYDSAGSFTPETNKAIAIQNEAYNWFGDSLSGAELGQNGAADWLTIGCSGGAFSKKILMGYDRNNHPSIRPSEEQNDTMMNLLTARYCDGENHTVTGTPIYWQNEWEWFAPPHGLDIEAVWDENGAVCLDNPRWADRETVEAECGPIPGCDEIELQAYHLISYLPAE